MDERIIGLRIGDLLSSEIRKRNGNEGLMSGKTGYALYLTNLYLTTHQEKYITPVFEFIQAVLKEPENLIERKTLCNGIAGFIWFLQFLERNKMIDQSVNYIDDQIFDYLFDFAASSFDDNWDFLHGSLGVVLACEKLKPEFGQLMKDRIEHGARKKENYCFWTQRNKDFKVDLGYAHGVSGILFFLSSVIENNSTMKSLAEGCFHLFDRAKLPESKISEYPCMLESNESSRLAWCYGDLALAYVMALYPHKKEQALELAVKTTARKTKHKTTIFDAGFCHGSAGVAQLYKKLNVLFDSKELTEAQDYWYNMTMNDLIRHDMKFWNSGNEKREADFSLISGLSGAGLVVLGLSNGWDECFMLKSLNEIK